MRDWPLCDAGRSGCGSGDDLRSPGRYGDESVLLADRSRLRLCDFLPAEAQLVTMSIDILSIFGVLNWILFALYFKAYLPVAA